MGRDAQVQQDAEVAKGQEQSMPDGCSWLQTLGGTGRPRIWEWEGDKSKWWGSAEGKERAIGMKLPGGRRGWLQGHGIFRVEFRNC